MGTRIAILSDVHADVQALRDALAQIERMRCDRIVCCGDIVDYGAYPEQTIELIRERRIPCVRGNHDRWALEMEKDDAPDLHLTARALDFLRSLPAEIDLSIEGVRIALRHGRPGSDMRGIEPSQDDADDLRQMLAEARADVLAVGHTHRTFALRAAGGGLVVNPGAVLRESITQFVPTPGSFGVLEVPSLGFTVYRASDGREVEILRRGVGAAR